LISYLDNKSQGRTNRSHCTYTPLVLCQTINYCSYLYLNRLKAIVKYETM